MRPVGAAITTMCRIGLEAMCRIDKSELHKVPPKGPLIAYSNHTGSVEVPLLYALLQPRPITGLAKVETWDGWFLGWVFTQWDIIPIRRGEADMLAMRKAWDVLKNGYILGIAPEGTRNKTGALIRAHPGIVTLALHADAPLLPVANWGGESFLKNLKRLRRTEFKIAVGRPFRINTHGKRAGTVLRQQIADEMMYQVAALLPERYRGIYSDLENATENYLDFFA